MQTEYELDTGVFTLSLDTELAWGYRDLPDLLNKHLYEIKHTRIVIDKLLKLLEKYRISADWAVVGGLLAESSEQKEMHPMIGPEEIWCGRDVVKKIMSSTVYQEIGCHSFSHVLFGDPKTERKTVREELEKCKTMAKKLGVTLNSFVFPRNLEGFYEEISSAGFSVFRGLEPYWYKKYPKKVQKACHVLDQFFALTPPVVLPEMKAGLVNIPGSMLYLSVDGFRKLIPVSCRVKKAKKGIIKAVKEKKVFHLWFHPHNLASGPDQLLAGLEEILKEADIQRNRGYLKIQTMEQIAKEIMEKNKRLAG